MTIESLDVAQMIEQSYREGYDTCLERLEKIAETESPILAERMRRWIDALRMTKP